MIPHAPLPPNFRTRRQGHWFGPLYIAASSRPYLEANSAPTSHCAGGQTALRQSWAQYFTSARCVILVVDSTDRARIGLVKAELGKLLEAEVRLDADLSTFKPFTEQFRSRAVP